MVRAQEKCVLNTVSTPVKYLHISCWMICRYIKCIKVKNSCSISGPCTTPKPVVNIYYLPLLSNRMKCQVFVFTGITSSSASNLSAPAFSLIQLNTEISCSRVFFNLLTFSPASFLSSGGSSPMFLSTE